MNNDKIAVLSSAAAWSSTICALFWCFNFLSWQTVDLVIMYIPDRDCSTLVLCDRTLSPGSITGPKTSQPRTPEPGSLYGSQYCQPGIRTPEERDGKSGVAGQQVFTFGWGKHISNLLCPESTLQTHLLSNKMDDIRLVLQGAGKLCDCCIKAIKESCRSLMRPPRPGHVRVTKTLTPVTMCSHWTRMLA